MTKDRLIESFEVKINTDTLVPQSSSENNNVDILNLNNNPIKIIPKIEFNNSKPLQLTIGHNNVVNK